jgi:hypothetical protein
VTGAAATSLEGGDAVRTCEGFVRLLSPVFPDPASREESCGESWGSHKDALQTDGKLHLIPYVRISCWSIGHPASTAMSNFYHDCSLGMEIIRTVHLASDVLDMQPMSSYLSALKDTNDRKMKRQKHHTTPFPLLGYKTIQLQALVCLM